MIGIICLTLGGIILYFKLSKKPNLWNSYKKGDGMYDYMTNFRMWVIGVFLLIGGIISIIHDIIQYFQK